MSVTSTPPWRSLYPFASQFLPLDGLRYHYLDEGRGEVLLLVHGNPTWSFYWHPLVHTLRDRYRLVVPDHIGCGLSDKPQQYPYTLRQHIENLTELIERLDLADVTLLAHDWGGPIGLGAALAVPQRFRRLVLLNTGAFPPPYIPLRIRLCRVPLLGTLAVRGLNLFARGALRMASANPGRLAAAVRAGLVAPYGSWSERVAIDRFIKDIPARPSHPTWQTLASIEDGLDRLREMPVQLIWGMRDWCFTSQCLERLTERLPQAERLTLDDAGHYVVLDAPERIVAQIERFLVRFPLRPPVP